MKNLFVCKVNYTKSFELVSVHLSDHRAYLAKGYESGILLASGPRVPKDGGIIIGAFASKQDAINFSKNDPFCKKNVAEYEIFEFEPVLSAECVKAFLS